MRTSRKWRLEGVERIRPDDSSRIVQPMEGSAVALKRPSRTTTELQVTG